jgi:hypothetical protein
MHCGSGDCAHESTNLIPVESPTALKDPEMPTRNPDLLAKVVAFAIGHSQAIPGVMFVLEVRIQICKIESPLIEGFAIAR